MEKLVSIITTVKNGEEYLEETLQTVLNQTYEQYEHIIIDDGSSDNTWGIIENFKKENPSHKINAVKTEGGGRAKALNMGVELAKGDWIAIIDADDLWHPKKLNLQMNFLEKNKNIDVLGTKVDFFSDINDMDFYLIENSDVEIIPMKKMAQQSCLNHSSAIIKKEWCLYDESRTSQLDYELWLRLLSRKKVLANLNMRLVYKRLHENQSFESKMGKKFRWNAFKLQAPYILDQKMYLVLVKRIIKLIVGYILPKSFIRRRQLKRID